MSDSYEIGHCKPPKHTQFRKGQSGNPRGRPRGSKNILTQIRDAVLGYIVTADGRKVGVGSAIIKSLIAQALKGNVRAAELLLNKMPELEALEVQEREDKSVESARILREAIRATFMPVEGARPDKGQGEVSEPQH